MAKSLADRVYAAVKRAGEPLTLGELARRLNLPRARKKELRNALHGLVREGRLVKGGRAGYLVPAAVRTVTGRLIAHADGYGFVAPEGGGEDVYVGRREMAGAMHGDTVQVQLVPRGDGRTQAAALTVLRRGRAHVVGRLERVHQRWHVRPLDGRLWRPVMVRAAEAKGARDGDLVKVTVTRYPERGEPMEGTISERLGDGSDPAMDTPLVLAESGINPAFPPRVLEQADALPRKLAPRHRKGREDLRDLPTVTIDGETAKDFDDAVSLLPEEGGGATLWVHIADVDEFAPAGSDLDREAWDRATSVYLPDRVVPMFPEALSNGICSLNPEQERCTLTAEMRFDAGGRRTGFRVYPSVIRSHARLTYTQVNRMLVDRDTGLRKRYAPLVAMLEGMERLAEQRMAVRAERGSLDFDLPEAMIVLGEGGEIREIVHQPREISHRLIEEFMLAANEGVAEWLTRGGWPCVYRVHEQPDAERLASWVPVARNILGRKVFIPAFGAPPPPKELQGLLAKAEGHPAEHVLNALLIRSLMQARYTGEHLMHYGLAAETYCHFTSPIRRYPDLMVHRLVKHRLRGGKWRELEWTRDLEGTAAHASERERRAMSAERRVVDIKKCRHLAARKGEVFDGVISSVARFGLFVELSGVWFDGLVPVENLPGRPTHDERHMALLGLKGQRWQVGDPVRARVVFVDVLAGKVTLDLV